MYHGTHKANGMEVAIKRVSCKCQFSATSLQVLHTSSLKPSCSAEPQAWRLHKSGCAAGSWATAVSDCRCRCLRHSAWLQVQIFEMMDEEARRRCLREVELLHQLQHPNIIQCHEHFMQAS